jgi:hypothetical protein
VSWLPGARPSLYSELEFNVHGMPPNSTFDIQRRFDTAPDGKCTSATWLELGTIKTSRAGTGTAHFTTARGAPFVTGFEFDIQYRVIGSDTELRSKCLTLVI